MPAPLSRPRLAVALLAFAAILLALVQLEGARAGIERIPLAVGDTPATLYRLEGDAGRRSPSWPMASAARGR